MNYYLAHRIGTIIYSSQRLRIVSKLIGLSFLSMLLGQLQPVHAQVLANRDSAEIYFERGTSFCEIPSSSKIPSTTIDRMRRLAMVNYTKSIAFDSTYYWSYRNRGYCHQNFKEYELALNDYNLAIVAGQQRGEADVIFVRFDCLELCQLLQRWAEAEVHCSTLLANISMCTDLADISCQGLWLTRGEARVKLKKYVEAKQDYLVYQQLVEAELAVERQKLVVERRESALIKNREKIRFTAKQPLLDPDGWGARPKKKDNLEITPMQKLERAKRMVAAKLIAVNKLIKQ